VTTQLQLIIIIIIFLWFLKHLKSLFERRLLRTATKNVNGVGSGGEWRGER
jgi:hypothetical protein